jgi:hypothetical protein
MTDTMKCYRITYTNFQGQPVLKAWRAKAPCYIRSKAGNQADCRTLGPVEEITEEEFERLTAGKKRAPISIGNRSDKAYL